MKNKKPYFNFFNLLNKSNQKNNSESESYYRILSDDSRFDVVESYKSIRTNIMFSLPKLDHGKVIVVTSASQGEGKTTTSINLAMTFAQTGTRVLLIDCDLRKPRIHRYLKMERASGISNVLCGFAELDDVIYRDVRKNMDCIFAGEIPPNPAEILSAPEFSKVLTKLKEKYDYIFLDTPPVTVVTDAVLVSKQCAGIVLIIRGDQSTFDLLDETIESIEKAEAKILGFVFLGSESNSKRYAYKKGGYNYKNNYSYNYSYGDDLDESK